MGKHDEKTNTGEGGKDKRARTTSDDADLPLQRWLASDESLVFVTWSVLSTGAPCRAWCPEWPSISPWFRAWPGQSNSTHTILNHFSCSPGLSDQKLRFSFDLKFVTLSVCCSHTQKDSSFTSACLLSNSSETSQRLRCSWWATGALPSRAAATTAAEACPSIDVPLTTLTGAVAADREFCANSVKPPPSPLSPTARTDQNSLHSSQKKSLFWEKIPMAWQETGLDK
jgi:hypothetical protein